MKEFTSNIGDDKLLEKILNITKLEENNNFIIKLNNYKIKTLLSDTNNYQNFIYCLQNYKDGFNKEIDLKKG